MKKPTKLRLRKETLRTLTEVHLTRVVAGGNAALALSGPDTGLKDRCVAAAVVIGGQ